jgi:sn1-specific diacylglycerol lipase
MAIYGHGMYLINHGIRGLCSLGWGLASCRGCRIPHERGDNLCRCYSTAFLQESRIDPDSVVYASFASDVVQRPYCVLVDPEFAAIVVVVRGTFALEDAVTDLTLSPVSLEEAGAQYGFDGASEYAHAGMFASAEWVSRDLKRTGALESLLGPRGSHPNYRLYITGHSLGAGVAAILALLLHSEFPTLKCLAFEPPGCVLSTGISMQDYILSFVHGDDIIPRLSVTALESLRDDVLEMIARSQVPKFKVLHPNPLLRRTKDEKLAHRRTSIPESSFYDQLKEFWAYHRDRKSERGERSAQLCIPGSRIVHLVKTKNGQGARATLPNTTPIWARRDDFLEIQLASSLVADHDTAILTRELESLAGTATSQPSG